MNMQSNLEAAQTGDRRQALERVRDTLATAIDGAVDRGDGTVAQLVAQYRSTLADLAVLAAAEPSKVVSPVDEIAARREDRAAGAANPVRAAGRRKSGNG